MEESYHLCSALLVYWSIHFCDSECIPIDLFCHVKCITKWPTIEPECCYLCR